MNAYEKLEIHNNPEFEVYIKNITSLNIDLFDKRKIVSFGEKYDILPEDVRKKIFEALEEIKKDEGYKSLCKAIYYFMKNSLNLDPLKPDFKEGIKAEFALFFPVWCVAQDFSEDMKKRKVPKEIITRSLAPICYYLKRNEELKGVMGTSASFTRISRYAKGCYFRVNDFEYEPAIHNGSDVLNLHIPPKTKLDVYENLKSFKDALDFFDKYYPEYKMTGIITASWLLSKEMEEVMGKSTNISRFGDMFERYDIGDTTGSSMFKFVYNLLPPYPPVEELPEDTSLQRNLKNYMLSGKKALAYGGYISRESINSRLKSFEV